MHDRGILKSEFGCVNLLFIDTQYISGRFHCSDARVARIIEEDPFSQEVESLLCFSFEELAPGEKMLSLGNLLKSLF
jgi:hypothetical protein